MQWLAGLNRRTLALLSLVLAAICLLGVNLFATEGLRQWRVDLTQNRLFTLTDATRQVLGSLDEPVTLKLYYSDQLGARAPNYARYAERIKALLAQYANLSGGKLVVEEISPEPFSDAEDRAVAAGLQGASLGEGQGSGYLGLVGTNSTDSQEIIGFFPLDRQDFLEYDLTRLVHKLADPRRKTVGLLTGLPMLGGMDPQRGQTQPWLIATQLQDFFNVKLIGPELDSVPADVDILMIVAPEVMSDETAFAIDQFSLSGKPVLAFVDPMVEVRGRGAPPTPTPPALTKLLASWGARIEDGKVAGDIDNARRVQYASGGQPVVAGYVAWLDLDRNALDKGDSLFSSIETLTLATPGAIVPVEGAGTRFTPIIRTGPRPMLIDTTELAQPDPVKLLQAYLPGKEPLTLAARLTGEARTAFPDGPPKAAEAADKPADGTAAATPPAGEPAPAAGSGANAATSASGDRKDGTINVILVADSDLLFDSFWAEVREVIGQRFLVPRANNADFVLNALENLGGGAPFAGLRGRGVEERPFTMVQQIRATAEQRYRQQEQLLNQNLEETQKKLEEITSKTQDGKVVLSEADKEAILGFRQQVVQIRQELRGVQRALRQDIDQLGFWLKAANIAGVPLAIAVIGMVGLGIRRRRHG